MKTRAELLLAIKAQMELAEDDSRRSFRQRQQDCYIEGTYQQGIAIGLRWAHDLLHGELE